MRDVFFERRDLQPPNILLKTFEEIVKNIPSSQHSGALFTNYLAKNLDFYKHIINRNLYSQLPAVFEALLNLARKRPAGFKSETDFIATCKENRHYFSYQQEFRLKSRSFFGVLRKPFPNDNPSKLLDDYGKSYFRDFLRSSLLICTVYNIELRVNNDPGLVPRASSLQTKDLYEQEEYYLFYNRSDLDDNKIGVGAVTIEDDTRFTIEFFHGLNVDHGNDTGKGYKSIASNGILIPYTSKGLLSLRSINPGNNAPEGFSETSLVLKRVGGLNENILLGICVSWNRIRLFPFATAVVLVKKDYYDKQYPAESDQHIDRVARHRRNADIPPEIFYYLFHQSISLEPILDQIITKDRLVPQPFTDFSQLPFMAQDGELIKTVEGHYKGLSLVHDGGNDLVICSRLHIEPNGRVTLSLYSLNANERGKFETDIIGYVKKVQRSPTGLYRLYLSLNYDKKSHFNYLNYFLEAEIDTKQPSPVIRLKGSFAGISVMTRKPLASAVIFERTSDASAYNVVNVELPDDDDTRVPLLDDLFKQHSALFQFFLRKDSNRYCTVSSTNKLREYFSPGKKSLNTNPDQIIFDVFISIPLTNSENEKEYDRNCRLVQSLRNCLVEKFNVAPARIFCGCNENGTGRIFSYEEYCKKATKKIKTYGRILEELDRSAAVIFVYPGVQPGSVPSNKVSSSHFEIGYAIGSRKRAAILYEQSQRDNLPSNMMAVYEKNTYEISMLDDDPITEFFGRLEDSERFKADLNL